MSETFLNEAYLCRQPVLDAQQDLAGYELQLQHPGQNAPTRADASLLICAAYAELGVRSALGRHRAFLRVTPELLLDDAIEALPRESVVLELALAGPPDDSLLERCRTLRERGYALGLTDYNGLDALSSPLLTMLEIVKVDVRRKEASQLANLAGPLAHLPLKLLAQGVRSQEEFAVCRDAGFQLFAGNYFARPEIVSGRRLSASQTTLIELINLAARDAETSLIENSIKRDPALAVNLLNIVNSVAYSLPQRIASLRQAITLLGRRQLQRWLHLLLMTPSGKTADAARTPILQVAALRGRMMELLLIRLRPGDPVLSGQGFIAGILSMMPAALGLPMNEIFEQIALDPDIVAALQSYQGPLGKMLALIECYDAEDASGCDQILAGFVEYGLDRQALNVSLIEALRWINDSDASD